MTQAQYLLWRPCREFEFFKIFMAYISLQAISA